MHPAFQILREVYIYIYIYIYIHVCDLFYPPSWGCDCVYHKLGNAPILRSGAGSWVLSGSSGVRHPLSPVIGYPRLFVLSLFES